MDPGRQPTEREIVSVSPRTVRIVLGNVLVLVALLALLWQARLVLGWTLMALLVALALHPVVVALQRRGTPHGWAVVIVMLLGLSLIVTTIGTIVPMVVEQAQTLVERAPLLFDNLAR